MSGLPVVLEVDGRSAVVVGGGRAGSRKIDALLAAGASVTVVDPADLADATWAAHDQVQHTQRPWGPGDSVDAVIVVVATDDPEVNEAAAEDARTAGALVLRSDGADGGDLRLPAVHRVGRVSVAVDTAGASPTLAGHLRDELATHTTHWADLADWAAANRPVTVEAIDQKLGQMRMTAPAQEHTS